MFGFVVGIIVDVMMVVLLLVIAAVLLDIIVGMVLVRPLLLLLLLRLMLPKWVGKVSEFLRLMGRIDDVRSDIGVVDGVFGENSLLSVL